MKKRLLVLFITLLLAISAGSLYAKDNPLLGEWVSASRTQGGLGGSRNYKEDGMVILTFGALLDFKYKVAGNILSLFNEKGELITEHEIKFSGSDLLLKNIKTGEEQKLTRVEGKPIPSIVGKWKGDHYTGGKQIMHFTTELNCYFSVPMVEKTANYKLDGDNYTEESAEKGKTEWKVTIKDDLLTLTKTDGSKIETYRREK